jgi:hypothetical protein
MRGIRGELPRYIIIQTHGRLGFDHKIRNMSHMFCFRQGLLHVVDNVDKAAASKIRTTTPKCKCLPEQYK